MILCEYGCGQESKYKFKNGKWCCCDDHRKCSEVIKKIRQKNLGKKRTEEFKKNISEKMKGPNNHMFGSKGYWYGKKRNKKDILKFKISHKQTIINIQKKYPLFSKIEEMRYEPGKEKERVIQVHCKNHNCKNSKEQGGWFTPTYIQLYERIRQLEKNDNDGCYFYCSNECKNECPLYGLNPSYEINKLNQTEFPYTQEEYQQFREYVLERDNYICQYCGEEAEHVHHERPQKLEPFYSLDPDLAWSTCKKCHYEKGHQDECSTGKLANKICK